MNPNHSIDVEADRPLFEASRLPRTDLNRDRDGDYKNPVVRACWATWLAAKRSIPAPAGQRDAAGCLKCPRDPAKPCDYCGLFPITEAPCKKN